MDNQENEMQALQYVWARMWWSFVVLGLIAALLGVFALVNPRATAALPIELLGVFIVLDGLVKIVTAVINRRHKSSLRLTAGGMEILIGIFLFVFALEIVTVAFQFILYLAGIGFLIAGGVAILQTVQGQREWSELLTGALKLGFGVLLFALTGPIAISLVWITGIFLLGLGAVLLFAGFRIRQKGRQLRPLVYGDIVEGQVVDEAEDGVVIEGEATLLPGETEKE